MARCPAPVRQCLIEHIRPHLARATDSTDDDGHPGYLARCPAHGDDHKSLSIHEGRHKRIVWHCHAGCGEPRVRHALIDLGVPAGCLPLSAKASQDLQERLWQILTDPGLSHAHARLRALAVLDRPDGGLPRGSGLEALAAAAHVSRREAYKAQGGRLSPDNRSG